MLIMVQKFQLASKQNELDIMKCSYFIECLDNEYDLTQEAFMEEYEDPWVDFANRSLDHNYYNNNLQPGQREYDAENNRYKRNKVKTKGRILNGVNSIMDTIGGLISSIVEKIVELFYSIYSRVMIVMKDAKTTMSIKKLKYIMDHKDKFKQHVVDDSRVDYVEKICDKFNVEVAKMILKSKHMGVKTLEARFDNLYKKTIDQLEKYMGPIPSEKKLPIETASQKLLKQLKSGPENVRKIEKRTTDFAKKVGKILETDEDAGEKKNIFIRVINKVTEVNAKCANFISNHPYAVMGTIIGVGTAAYAGYRMDVNKAYDSGYNDGYAAL